MIHRIAIALKDRAVALLNLVIAGDPAEGPNAWGGSPEPAAGTAKYNSAPCVAARKESSDNVGSFEIYNYYDTCYGTSGITTADDRAALSNYLTEGGEFGAFLICT